MKNKKQQCPKCDSFRLRDFGRRKDRVFCVDCEWTGDKAPEKPDRVTLELDTLTAERILNLLQMTNRFKSDIGNNTSDCILLGMEQEFNEALQTALK